MLLRIRPSPSTPSVRLPKSGISPPDGLFIHHRANSFLSRERTEDLVSMSIAEANFLLANQATTPLDLLQQSVSVMQRRNPEVNAFVGLEDGKMMLEQATASGYRWIAGEAKGPLDGVPIAVKDNFATKNISTSCASNILKGTTSPYDATVVRRLRDAGAIVIGKTNLDEFGMGSANVHSVFGPVYNPCGPFNDPPSKRRVAGGSSGGSAAAVAAGMVFAALGSDTGGSVRLPASYCGVVGFKPSYGRCSRWGLVAYANSLDTVGMLGRSVGDAEAIYKVISGYDEKDPTSLPQDLRDRIDSTFPSFQRRSGSDDLTGLRVGVPQEYHFPELSSSVVKFWRASIRHLRSRGATIVSISLPMTRHALPAYYILAPAEASSNLARFDGVRYGRRVEGNMNDGGTIYSNTRSEGFGDEVRRRIILGTYVLTEGSYDNYFLRAQKIRRLVQQDFDRVFIRRNPLHTSAAQPIAGVHVILTPSAISTAPRVSDCLELEASTLEAYVNDVMTVPASLAGIPAMSVPIGICEEESLPVGMQVLGQFGDESIVFEIGRVLEEGLPFASN